MKLLTQIDPRWANHIMTSPEHQSKPDYIRDWGCLITALCNLYNMRYKVETTPAEMNRKIIEKKGYKYLALGKECPKGEESYLLWEIAKGIFSIEEVVNDFKGKINIKCPDTYYIARAVFGKTGHYGAVVGAIGRLTQIVQFHDSYTGRIRCEIPTKITAIKFS